ncbi:MAG: hypothetical protein FWH48_00745 [Oscillospiraceae bacterium]|nr:hypothetical protein [Oscillospiraceae bacterium]
MQKNKHRILCLMAIYLVFVFVEAFVYRFYRSYFIDSYSYHNLHFGSNFSEFFLAYARLNSLIIFPVYLPFSVLFLYNNTKSVFFAMAGNAGIFAFALALFYQPLFWSFFASLAIGLAAVAICGLAKKLSENLHKSHELIYHALQFVVLSFLGVFSVCIFFLVFLSTLDYNALGHIIRDEYAFSTIYAIFAPVLLALLFANPNKYSATLNISAAIFLLVYALLKNYTFEYAKENLFNDIALLFLYVFLVQLGFVLLKYAAGSMKNIWRMTSLSLCLAAVLAFGSCDGDVEKNVGDENQPTTYAETNKQLLAGIPEMDIYVYAYAIDGETLFADSAMVGPVDIYLETKDEEPLFLYARTLARSEFRLYYGSFFGNGKNYLILTDYEYGGHGGGSETFTVFDGEGHCVMPIRDSGSISYDCQLAENKDIVIDLFDDWSFEISFDQLTKTHKTGNVLAIEEGHLANYLYVGISDLFDPNSTDGQFAACFKIDYILENGEIRIGSIDFVGDENPPALAAYEALLAGFHAESDIACFAMRDLDGDGAPELLIVQEDKNALNAVLSVYAYCDEVYKIGDYSNAGKSFKSALRFSGNPMFPGLFDFWLGGGARFWLVRKGQTSRQRPLGRCGSIQGNFGQ